MVTHTLAYGQARRTANLTCRSTRSLASDGDLAEPYTRMIPGRNSCAPAATYHWLAIGASRQRTITEPHDTNGESFSS